MRQSWAKEFSVGFVLFVATIVVMVGLFLVGNAGGPLSRHAEYRVLVPTVLGIREGSTVYLSGVPVGQVERIDFSSDPGIPKVEVTLAVVYRHSLRIGPDSTAWIKNEGLLGDAAFHVSLSAEGERLRAGSEIPYRPRAMLDDFAGEGSTETAASIMETAIAILNDVQKGEGTLGQLLKNPELYDNLSTFTAAMQTATKRVETLSSDLGEIITAIKESRGVVGKAIFSEQYAQRVGDGLAHIEKVAGRVDRILADVEDGEESIGRVVLGAALHASVQRLIDHVDAVAADVHESLRGESIVADLVRDAELAANFKTLVARLESSSGSLERILGSIEAGEGSLGMLYRDPSIAGSLRDLFLGVEDAGYVLNLVRNAERAGRERYLEAAGLDEAERRELQRLRVLSGVGTSSEDGPESANDRDGDIRPAAHREGDPDGEAGSNEE